MAEYIKKKYLKQAVKQLPWHHINPKGELVEGACGREAALVKYCDILEIVERLPTTKIAKEI